MYIFRSTLFTFSVVRLPTVSSCCGAEWDVGSRFSCGRRRPRAHSSRCRHSTPCHGVPSRPVPSRHVTSRHVTERAVTGARRSCPAG